MQTMMGSSRTGLYPIGPAGACRMNQPAESAPDPRRPHWACVCGETKCWANALRCFRCQGLKPTVSLKAAGLQQTRGPQQWPTGATAQRAHQSVVAGAHVQQATQASQPAQPAQRPAAAGGGSEPIPAAVQVELPQLAQLEADLQSKLAALKALNLCQADAYATALRQKIEEDVKKAREAVAVARPPEARLAAAIARATATTKRLQAAKETVLATRELLQTQEYEWAEAGAESYECFYITVNWNVNKTSTV